MSKITRRTDFGPHGFRWLTLKRIEYEDPHGRLRFWESAERLSRHGDVDGVAIVTLVRSKEEPLKVILEAQFRPSQGNTVIELPAGLIDTGESAAEAAVRELKEETGYTGRVTEVSPICFSDPGMSNANMQFAVVDVDADASENADINPELEEGEFIDVFLLPYDGLYDALLAKQKETGWDVDARLLMYADAIKRTAQRVFAQEGTPEDIATADSVAATSAHSDEPLASGLPRLHIKTRADAHTNGSSAANSDSGASAESAARSSARAADKAAHSFQEGFIPQDPSPAVLKTEFPHELEHVTEHPPLKTIYNDPDGEILLENEAAPGRSSEDNIRQPSQARPESQAREGVLDLERRPSIDLAAGLNRSPRRAPGADVDDDMDIRPGLFPHFRSAAVPAAASAATPAAAEVPNGHASEEIFASPFKRQGSLFSMEPISSGDLPTSSADGSAKKGNGSNVVYCPVGITPAKNPDSGVSESKEAATEKPADVAASTDGAVEMQCELQGAKDGRDLNLSANSNAVSFGLGVVLGGLVGALLAYSGGLRRT